MNYARVMLSCFLLLSMITFFSCDRFRFTYPIGQWEDAPDFKGAARAGAFCFVIDRTAYVGLGHDGYQYRHESYAYNLDSGFWKKIAAFPGEVRERMISFSLYGKGYIGTGYNRDSVIVQLKDFWEYDPTVGDSGVWTRKKDFEGAARYNAVAFTDGTYGFVGTGFSGVSTLSDFFKYDPENDTWSSAPAFPGTCRQSASVLSFNEKIFLVGGGPKDFWSFDLKNQNWKDETPSGSSKQFHDFAVAVSRSNAATFTLNNMGYIAAGISPSSLNTVYQFNPEQLTWHEMTPYPKDARWAAVCFVIGNRAFLGTGGNYDRRFDNMNEFFIAP